MVATYLSGRIAAFILDNDGDHMLLVNTGDQEQHREKDGEQSDFVCGDDGTQTVAGSSLKYALWTFDHDVPFLSRCTVVCNGRCVVVGDCHGQLLFLAISDGRLLSLVQTATDSKKKDNFVISRSPLRSFSILPLSCDAVIDNSSRQQFNAEPVVAVQLVADDNNNNNNNTHCFIDNNNNNNNTHCFIDNNNNNN
eukprot:Lankesteria_metandrocarpae@DN7648_c0_g1_i1.p1